MQKYLGKLMVWVLCALSAGAAATSASAQENAPIQYQVKSGDTLHGLHDRYFVGRDAVARIAKLNKVKNPRLLQIGSNLEIPRNMLKYRKVTLKVQRFSGPVMIAGERAAAGSALAEGGIVRTGARGFVTFGANRGSVISLPSNSRARLKRARLYVLDDILDVDFEVLNGRSEIKAPKLRKQERFELRTPLAVTAVRGTEFRVGFDEATSVSATEVVEGSVSVASGGEQNLAPAGFGVPVTAAGLGEPEALLPAPVIADAEDIQTGKEVSFAVTPDATAIGYRTQIARDATFLDVVAESVTDAPEVSFTELENGRYFVRARAISATGIEGLAEPANFRRKRLGVTPSIEESPIADGYRFGWLSDGEGKSFYAFQMWKVDQPDAMIVDETGLASEGIVLTGLDAGKYQWRVAVMQAETEGLLKVWGPTQSLSVSE